MVRTDEVMTGIAHMPVRQHGTAMRAAIEQHMERAIIAAHQYHRLAANLECGEIAFIFYLAFMTSINPALVENVVDFLLEDLKDQALLHLLQEDRKARDVDAKEPTPLANCLI